MTLSWNAPGATTVTIPGLGSQALSGSLRIQPEASRSILLIADYPASSVVKHAEVKVVGDKGDSEDFEADLHLFRYPKQTTIGEFGPAVDEIKKQIEDRFGFITRYNEFSDGHVQMQTNHWQVPNIQKNLAPHFTGRRISYLLDMARTGKASTAITIRSFIESRRELEETWYPDGDDQLYQSETARIVDAIQVK